MTHAKRREMVKVLFDHNMPPALARGLNEIIQIDGHSAIPLRAKFATNISDLEYFNILGKEKGWIVISKDLQNSKKRAERAAILANKITAFYLSPGLQKKKITEQAAVIFWHWDRILLQLSLTDRGLFQLPENKGRFKPL